MEDLTKTSIDFGQTGSDINGATDCHGHVFLHFR